jgi:hypothetical protein
MQVAFDQLNDLRTARRVWLHLLPGIAFDQSRWNLLQGFNVQQHFAP